MVDPRATARRGGGEGSEGAGQGVRGDREVQPGGVGVELPRRQVRQWPVDQVGEDLFDHGVAAVLGLGLGQPERAVGEHRVIAVDGEQLVLALGGGLGVEPAHAAHDQSPVGAVRFEEANAV